MEHFFGIDLGTTYSVVAHAGRQGRPACVPVSDGATTLPSAVCFRDGALLVGRAAKEALALGAPGMQFFKRAMGDPRLAVTLGPRTYGAEELSALVLAELKRAAESALGTVVEEAVITVPAYFRDPERRATLRAGELAGLRVPQVINEPTAAALAYGFGRFGARRTLAVYDLGGGTFDVTVLLADPDGVVVLTSDGDHQLGGKDWDDRLIEWFASEFRDRHGLDPTEDEESLAELRAHAEQAKRQLSQRQRVELKGAHAGRSLALEIDRAKFEELTLDLLHRTADLTRRALESVALRPEDVDEFVLVGGSTRMPMVRDLVTRDFGKEPVAGINVDEVVAVGAALAHRALHVAEGPRATLRYRDVATHSLGMIALDEAGTAFVNSIIVPKNRELPCREVRPFQHRVRREGEGELEVYVTQGESSSPAEVAYLGRYRIRGLPLAPQPHVLDIAYGYDASGTVQVSCTVRADGRSLAVERDSLPEDIPGRFLRPPVVRRAEAHITAYLCFDVSGSMNGTPLEKAKDAARGFLRNLDLAHASLGLLAFSDRVLVALEACQDARRIEGAISALACGSTGYGNATDPFEKLSTLLAASTGRRFAVVLADGVWDQQARAVERARSCHAAGIDVIAIGFGGADKGFLSAIASCPEASLFTTVEDLDEVFTTVAQVLTESGAEQRTAELGVDVRARLGMVR